MERTHFEPQPQDLTEVLPTNGLPVLVAASAIQDWKDFLLVLPVCHSGSTQSLEGHRKGPQADLGCFRNTSISAASQ